MLMIYKARHDISQQVVVSFDFFLSIDLEGGGLMIIQAHDSTLTEPEPDLRFCSRRMGFIKIGGIKGCSGTVMNSNPKASSGDCRTMGDKSDKSQPTVSGLSIPL